MKKGFIITLIMVLFVSCQVAAEDKGNNIKTKFYNFDDLLIDKNS